MMKLMIVKDQEIVHSVKTFEEEAAERRELL